LTDIGPGKKKVEALDDLRAAVLFATETMVNLKLGEIAEDH
jgi:hypothetical protein